MFLIVIGCIVPVLALASALRMSIDWSGKPGPAGDAGHPRSRSVRRWEGVADEMRRRGNRGRPRTSDAATRRRHLAAVLPADARR
jgi:hypothetical protein